MEWPNGSKSAQNSHDILSVASHQTMAIADQVALPQCLTPDSVGIMSQASQVQGAETQRIRVPPRTSRSGVSKRRVNKQTRLRKRKNDGDRRKSNLTDGNIGDESTIRPGNLWACPFYKLDPLTHYRCVEKYKLKRFVDVKQHIDRCHSLEKGQYCDRCWSEWTSPTELESHKITGDCPILPEPESLKEDEVKVLKSVPQHLNEQEKWYWVWEKLFQGHQPPPSPQVEDGIHEPLRLLRNHVEATLSDRLPTLLQSYNVRVDAEAVPEIQTGIIHTILDYPHAAQKCRLRPDYVADRNINKSALAADISTVSGSVALDLVQPPTANASFRHSPEADLFLATILPLDNSFLEEPQGINMLHDVPEHINSVGGHFSQIDFSEDQTTEAEGGYDYNTNWGHFWQCD